MDDFYDPWDSGDSNDKSAAEEDDTTPPETDKQTDNRRRQMMTARSAARRRAAKRTGRRSTTLTSGQGVLAPKNVKRKVLLGEQRWQSLLLNVLVFLLFL